MGIARANIIVGPARIVRGAGTVYTKDSFEVRLNHATFDVVVDALGKVDERSEDATAALQFTPEGRWDAATRAFLWPYLNPTIGMDVFGAADTPTLIHDSNAHLHTIPASAVTQMPNLKLSPVDTMVGACTITGIRANNGDWDDADSLYTAASAGGVINDAGFTPPLIKTQVYTGAWAGSAGFGTIKAQAGWDVEFETQISFIKVDEIGTVKGILTRVGVMARCMPVAGPTSAQIVAALKMQDAGGARGRSLNATGADLVITGADAATVVTVKKAGLKTAGFRFGLTTIREGELAWVATRDVTAGVPQALCTLA